MRIWDTARPTVYQLVETIRNIRLLIGQIVKMPSMQALNEDVPQEEVCYWEHTHRLDVVGNS